MLALCGVRRPQQACLPQAVGRAGVAAFPPFGEEHQPHRQVDTRADNVHTQCEHSIGLHACRGQGGGGGLAAGQGHAPLAVCRPARGVLVAAVSGPDHCPFCTHVQGFRGVGHRAPAAVLYGISTLHTPSLCGLR